MDRSSTDGFNTHDRGPVFSVFPTKHPNQIVVNFQYSRLCKHHSCQQYNFQKIPRSKLIPKLHRRFKSAVPKLFENPARKTKLSNNFFSTPRYARFAVSPCRSFTQVEGDHNTIQTVGAAKAERGRDTFIVASSNRRIPAELIHHITKHYSQTQIFVYIKQIPKINSEALPVTCNLIFTAVRIIPE